MKTIAMTAAGLDGDYGALVRHLAKLQMRISDLVALQTIERHRLEAQLTRLHAGRIVAETQRFWHVASAGTPHAVRDSGVSVKVDPGPATAPEDLRQAREAICETGCQGHAHPWLSAGRCQLSGNACDRLAREN